MKKNNISNVIKKISFTLLIVLIYVMGLYLPLPFAEVTKQYSNLLNETPLTLLGSFSGANFNRLSVFSIGLSPMMISMLIIQVLTFTKAFGFDALTQKQVQYVMQFMTIVIAIVQSILLVFSFINKRNFLRDFQMVTILTAGSCLVVWLCLRNMKYGVGAGAPVILTSTLNSAIPNFITNFRMFFSMSDGWIWSVAFLIFLVLVTRFWIAFNDARYQLKIINPSMPSNTKEMTVPIGLNMAAMMMYMVGSSLLTLPVMIGRYYSSDSLINNLIFQIFISAVIGIGIFYFFTFVNFDPKEKAKEYRNNHFYIKNIAPGLPTKKYLQHILLIIAFPGAILNTLQFIVGLYGARFLGVYSDLAVVSMNIVMITMFMGGIKDNVNTLLFASRYKRLMKDKQ